MYNFDISRTALYPEEDVLVCTSMYHFVLPCTRGTGFQMEFELHIETGSHPQAMPRSRPMKRWSQGELDECSKQVAYLLDQGWIVPSRASHAASIVFKFRETS